MVCRWAQELSGYYFTIVHISNKMMVNVDAFTWYFVHIISHHIDISALLISHNRAKRPCAYDATESRNLGNVKIS